jgi:hypothetical protein
MKLGLGLAVNNKLIGGGGPYGKVLRIAATLGRISGANADGGNDGTNTEQVTRTVHRTGRKAVTGLRLVVGNVKLIGVSPFGEAGVGNAITYRSAIEFGGANSYALWNGANSKSVADKSIAVSDAIRDMAAGQLFYVRNYLVVAAPANKWPRAQTVTQGTQYAKKGTALLSTFEATGAVSGTPQDGPNPPIALIGYVDRDSVAVVYTGDSIADNTGDLTTIDADGTVGFVGRGLVNVNGFNVPHAKLSRSGETLQALVDPVSGAIRRSLFQYATHYVSELGVNDINAGRTFAQMTADYLQEWAYARAAGIQYICRTTLTPQTTAPGNDFSTLVNQSYKTGFEPGGLKDQLNAWFVDRRNDGTINGIVDVAADCGDASDPNKWRVDLGAGNNTADGTHPASPIHTLAAARLNAAAVNWTAY